VQISLTDGTERSRSQQAVAGEEHQEAQGHLA
jgi:hypothetical protein